MKTATHLALWLLASTPLMASAATAPQARKEVKRQAVKQVQQTASAEPAWSLTLGAGLGTAPLYEGSRAYEFGVVPYAEGSLQTEWLGAFSLSNAGLGWTPLAGDRWQATLLLSQDGGREERFKHSQVRGSEQDRNHLNGMGKIKSTMEAGVALGYQLDFATLNLQVMQDVLNRGHKGVWVDLGISREFELSPHWSTSLSLQTRWGDKDYMQSMFGVDAEQAARSGFRQYHPAAGIKSVNLGSSLSYAINDHWNLVMMVDAGELVGDAADSPIVQSRYQLGTVVGSTYRF